MSLLNLTLRRMGVFKPFFSNVRPCLTLGIRQYTGKPTLNVDPRSSLFDDPVSIKVQRVQPNSRISIRSTMQERGDLYEAVAHFIADGNGTVDLDEHQSVGGNYTGIEPMGLLWSMQPSSDARKGTRYIKKDVTKPAEVTFSVFNDHSELESITSSQPLACTTIERWFMRSEHVDRIKVHHGRIRGTLFKPKGPGPFPAVIDLFGGVGGVVEFRSALLASRGFASLALPYFQYEDLPKDFFGLQFEYFKEAVEWLTAQSCVLSSGIGIMGTCYGGSIGLLMAAELPQIKAAVLIGTMPIFIFPFFYKGSDVGLMKNVSFQNSHINDNGAVVMRDMGLFVKDLPPEELISIEKSEGHFLFIVGEDDHNCPSLEAATAAIDKLRSHGKNNYELLSYPGAGHLIEPPHKPSASEGYNHPFGVTLDFGGEPKAHAHASQDAWVKSMNFLRKYIVGDTIVDNLSTVQLGSKINAQSPCLNSKL